MTTLGGYFLRFDANYGGAGLKKCANALIIRFSSCALKQLIRDNQGAARIYPKYKK
jgi:hypothetical protein